MADRAKLTNAERGTRMRTTTLDDETWDEAQRQAEEIAAREGGRATRARAIAAAVWANAPPQRRAAYRARAEKGTVTP